MEKTTAILINRHRLTESSLIVHWCSEELGLFKTVANGALRPKSAFAGRLDLMVTCEVMFTRSRVSDLHTLKEAHLLETRTGIRGNYGRVIAGTYFCKLIEMVSEWESPLGGVHEVLHLSLDYLHDHDATLKLVERFEDRLCVELGLGTVQSGHGARLLQEVFHRPLPAQRAELVNEWRRKEG